MTKLLVLILPFLFANGNALGQAYTINGPIACDLSADLISTQPVVCAGASTGSAVISVSNATLPVLFFPNGMGSGLPNGNLTNIFAAGAQFVIVLDSAGCRDTVYFTINGPPPIILATVVNDALCNGDPDGSVTASATGGTGNISFAWQGCLGGTIVNNATATDLYAGCYSVTATDANGCSATTTATVGEPTPFAFNSSQDSVNCNGASDGTATIEVSGGTQPYQYVWDDGDTTPTAIGLDAGFHFVTITDASGCIAATFVQVFEPALFVIDSIMPVATSCAGGNNGMATVFVSGGTASYAYLWSNMQVAKTAQNLSVGSYSVTVTDARGCTAATSVTIGSPPPLSLSVLDVAHEKCAGDCDGAATVGASGGTGPYNYLWDDPLLLDGPPTVTGLCPGNYMVTVEDFRGCTQTDKVTIEPALALDIHIDSIPPTCSGVQDGSIFVSVSGGSSPYQILWSDGATGPSRSNLSCGNYAMTLTDDVGCTAIDTISLPCPTELAINSVVAQPVKCFGESNGQITAYATGGTGMLTYRWNDPNMQADSTAVNLFAGTYSVTVTDASGCIAIASGEITQPDLLDVATEKTDVTCFGGTNGTAMANPVGGTEPYDYAWNWTPSDKTISSLPAGIYIVTVIDANGCTDTASATLFEPPSPLQMAVSQTGTACFEGNNGSALATASGGNGPVFNYIWSNGQTTPSATDLANGIVTVTATDSKGCSVVQSIDVQEFAPIQVGAAYVSPTCFDRADGKAVINLLEGGAGMGDTTQYNYQWSIPNSPNSIYVDVLAGDQNYTVTVTDFQGCTGTFSFYLQPAPQIVVQSAIQNVSCFGLSDGSAMVTGIEGAKLPASYSWSSGETGPQITDKPVGDYVLSVVDALGCTQSDTIPITEPALLGVAFDLQPLVCSSDSNAVITANIQGGTPEYTLQWNTGATSAQINNLAPDTYILDITDKNGCTFTDSILVARPDSLTIQTEKSNPLCFGGMDGRIQLLVSGGQVPLGYSVNGGPFGGSTVFIGLKAGHYTFQVRDGKGCITTIIDSLGQPPQVSVSLGLDTTITLGDSLLVMAEASNAFGMLDYEWRSVLLENLSCVDSPECSIILVKPYQTNTYSVHVTDENGCRGKASVTVRVDKPRGVYVPSGFSPNGDLNNDLLAVFGKSRQIRNVLTFNVYDRWGELVYQDQNFQVNEEGRGWDGSFRGKACDPGVYVWYVEVEYQDGYNEIAKGNVTLIR